jgi:hypothetical protein
VRFGASIPGSAPSEVSRRDPHLAPLLLGDGIRFFGGPGTGRVFLEKITVADEA